MENAKRYTRICLALLFGEEICLKTIPRYMPLMRPNNGRRQGNNIVRRYESADASTIQTRTIASIVSSWRHLNNNSRRYRYAIQDGADHLVLGVRYVGCASEIRREGVVALPTDEQAIQNVK